MSATLRSYNKLLHAFGTESPKADFFGHPYGHPLADTYFSQAPIRYGDFVAKLGAFPVGPAQAALKDWRLRPHEDEDGFRHAAVNYFQTQAAVFEIRAQLWSNADSQPIDDSSVEWPEIETPYVTVATLKLPAQARSARLDNPFSKIF